MLPRYGPWTPPAAVPSSGTTRYSPTFPAAGTYRVVVSLSTSNCTSPYGSDRQVTTEIVVTDPPAPAQG